MAGEDGVDTTVRQDRRRLVAAIYPAGDRRAGRLDQGMVAGHHPQGAGRGGAEPLHGLAAGV